MTILIDRLIDEKGRWLYVSEANKILSAQTGRNYTSHPRAPGDVASPIFNAIRRGLVRAKTDGPWITIEPESFRQYVREFRARPYKGKPMKS